MMPEPTVRPLGAEALTPEGFAPFGVLPTDEGAPGPTADLEFRLDDGWVNYIGHTADEVPVVDGAYRCELLNRHDTHTQTLMPVDGDAVLVVAPPAASFEGPAADAALGTVRAFLLRRLECVHLLRGTWHWGPYPATRTGAVRLLNVQGRGYKTDNAVADLPGAGAVFAVR